MSLKLIRWIARIWSLPLIAYTLVMLISSGWNWITIGTADPYIVEGTTFLDALPPILYLLSVIGLGLAWRWEMAGSLISLAFLDAALVALFFQHPLSNLTLQRAIPYLLYLVVLIPGVLFLLASRGKADPQPA